MNCVPIFLPLKYYRLYPYDTLFIITGSIVLTIDFICIDSIEWSLFDVHIDYLRPVDFYVVINHCAKVTELLLWYFLEQLEAGKVPLLHIFRSVVVRASEDLLDKTLK